MPVLQLPACPICGAQDSLVRQVLDRAEHSRTAYGCWECSSVLVWLGDDLWLQSGRWAYQHVGRPEKRHLLHRPMTAAELQRLAESMPGVHPRSEAGEGITEIDGLEAGPGEEVVEAEVSESTPPPPPSEEARASAPPPSPGEEAPEFMPPPPPLGEEPWPTAWDAGRDAARGAGQDVGWEPPREPARGPVREGERRHDLLDVREGAAALVPMAQILPEGMKLALVRYDGLRAEPVAIFHEGELRAIPSTPPRSKGSPLLWIGVALTLLCFACAASTVLLSGFLEGGLPVAMPAPVGAVRSTDTVMAFPTVQPTQTPLPTDTPAPTDTPQATDTAVPTAEPTVVPQAELQGVTAYMPAPGSLTIVGEVLNVSGHDLRFVEVLGTFFDSEGTLIGTDSAYAELNTVEVGGRAPFRLVAQGLPSSLTNYDLRVNYVTADEEPLRVEVVSQRAFRGEDGTYRIVGEVRNPHGYAVGSVEVIATYYNAAYQVVRVEKAFAEASRLEPGQASPFELVLADLPPDLSHYRLQTEAVLP
jgi:hypothetical protein